MFTFLSARLLTSIIHRPTFLRNTLFQQKFRTTMGSALQLNIDESFLKSNGIELCCDERTDGTVLMIEMVRERALNALNTETINIFNAVLDAMKKRDDITQLVFLGRGRAFSAGGDIRTFYSKLQATNTSFNSIERKQVSRHILSTEYDFLDRLSNLDTHIETIAICDGIAFGAGQGLFQACRTRIVTPRALLSMPECRIGIIPDCGASHFLTRTPGSVGMYVALTGERITGADALALGLADACAPSGWRGASLTGQKNVKDFNEVRKEMTALETGLANSESNIRRAIDHVFSKNSIQEIVDKLNEYTIKHNGNINKDVQEWAMQTHNAITTASPIAIHETFRIMREGYQHGGGLRIAMDRELEVDVTLTSRHDFIEGIRAALIDKDQSPKWHKL